MTTTTDHRRTRCTHALSIAFGVMLVVGAWDATRAAHAASQRAPWCAALGGKSGAWDCGYYTFEQCMATARGLGGYCSPNPGVAFDPYRQPRRVRK